MLPVASVVPIVIVLSPPVPDAVTAAPTKFNEVAAVDNAQQKRKVRSFLAAHDQRGTLSCWELPV